MQLLEITNHLLLNASSCYMETSLNLKILFLVRHEKSIFVFCFVYYELFVLEISLIVVILIFMLFLLFLHCMYYNV